MGNSEIIAIQSYRFGAQINSSVDFNDLIWSNYLKYSRGRTMREYAAMERKVLSDGIYGVEDYYPKVFSYLGYLDELISK
ncbi:MAG: hypothetical protein AAGA43_02495 [Bacteroidota bacterium]